MLHVICFPKYYNAFLTIISRPTNRPLFSLLIELICIHCNNFVTGEFISADTDSVLQLILEHCRSCPHMERPNKILYKYVCFACTYHSYNVGNLKTHVRTHTGDKPYKCDKCPYSSASVAGIAYHNKRTGHSFQYYR